MVGEEKEGEKYGRGMHHCESRGRGQGQNMSKRQCAGASSPALIENPHPGQNPLSRVGPAWGASIKALSCEI